jgi:hypothetical protein
MPFSKFDPDRPVEDPETEDASAARRVRILRYWQWISSAFTALGFAIIAYLLLTR